MLFAGGLRYIINSNIYPKLMNIGITAQIITELTYNCLTVGLKRKLTEFSKYPIARFFEMINLFAIEQNIFLT